MPPLSMINSKPGGGLIASAVPIDPYAGLSPDEKADKIATEVESLKERVRKAEQRQSDAEMAAAYSRGGGQGFA